MTVNGEIVSRAKTIGGIAGWVAAVILATLQIEGRFGGYMQSKRSEQQEVDRIQTSLDALHAQDGTLQAGITESVASSAANRERIIAVEREQAAFRGSLEAWKTEINGRLERIERKLDTLGNRRQGSAP